MLRFLFLSLVSLWFVGLIYFASHITQPPSVSSERTEAIVVWTGATHRLAVGFELLDQGLSERLFISGVHPFVKIETLIPSTMKGADLSQAKSRTTLGYKATNTGGNALETKEWMQKHNLRSIRLVTSTYHMPRSLLEMKKVAPNLTIVPHPVIPEEYKSNIWWLDKNLFLLTITEYSKYLYCFLRG